jgi:DNA replication ATP-dependent helicase Dna2
MALLLQFQGPDLMVTDEHPEVTVAYPVVPLLTALGKLLAVPVDVSYTLPETLRALGSGFNYQRKDFYHYPIGHGLRSDAIHAAWHRNMPEQVNHLRQEARLYLFALWALLREMRMHAKDQLFAWAAKFTFPPVAPIKDALLSRLAFFARYESLMACLALRDQRAEARAVQSTLGTTLELVAVDGFDMHTVGDPLLEVEKTDFPAWLLVRDNDAGRRAQLEFKDYYYRNYPSSENYGPKPADHLAIVSVKDDPTTDDLGFVRGLRLKAAKNFVAGPPQRGERFLLYPRFQDYNADRIIDFLQECDTAGGGLFLQVLRDPERAAGLGPLPGAVERAASAIEKELKFTDSQGRAFREIRLRKVVAVWGPPGTGKTHFLATAILGLAAAHARAGKPFRVLVTAFTHNAIENLLRKIVERQGQLGLAGLDLAVAKAKEWKSSEDAATEVVEEKHAAAWIAGRNASVLGATVYSCLKARQGDGWPAFDLVIVDEASQVRVPEASVPFSMVSPQGRVVLAGDHLQLPPIVQGEYPDAPPGQPTLHRSIFELLQVGVNSVSPVVQKLLENHRMNDVLTRFARELLYGPGYRCFDARVERQRLDFHPPAALEPILAACLDPAFPLVVVMLEGVQAAGENPVEAALVARLVQALRAGLRDKKGQPYAGDAAFFKHGVFIVSPHRAQNRAIRRELRGLRAWTSRPFVDTVDKMQGQEAEAVVVSYGVSDPEYALREAEFIYSLNRLNVSITRARCKSVVCLPKPLLDASPQVLDVPEAARGLAFMRGLVQAVAALSPPIVFDLGGGVRATVLRADR